MSLLAILSQAVDEEQLRLQPLPKHALADEVEHLRRHYALLLAATLSAQGIISEAQSRLFRLLLDALALGDIHAALFDEARVLSLETLLEAARLIRTSNYASHFLLDALVLLRIEAPLADEMARLIAELTAFLGLTEPELRWRVRDAAVILKLPADNEEALTEEARCLLAECWPMRLSRPLTEEALRAGLDGGLWVLEAPLEIDFPWQAANAWILYRPGARLLTNLKGKEVALTDCRLIHAAMSFTGQGGVKLERCHWEGSYDPALEVTALDLLKVALTAQDCEFGTQGARAIACQDAVLTLKGCRFTGCGHPALEGGAVRHDESDREIEDCRFDRCVGAKGGAIRVDYLKGIRRCEFIACMAADLTAPTMDEKMDEMMEGLIFISKALYGYKSSKHAVAADLTEPKKKAKSETAGAAIAIFSSAGQGDSAVVDCVFRLCSLVLGNASWGSRVIFVRNCQFENGNIYYHNKYPSNIIAKDCSFKIGDIIEHKFA